MGSGYDDSHAWLPPLPDGGHVKQQIYSGLKAVGPSDSEPALKTDLLEETDMLWTVFVVLLVLWLLGLVSSYTLGGFIHILLVLALVVLVINLLSGRRTAV
jgi:hypothetical protein